MASLVIPALILGIIVLSVVVVITYRLGMKHGSYRQDLRWQQNLVKIRGEIAQKQRAGIKGKVTETFAPFLEGFPFKASECKFLGDPIDYVVFEGLDERDVTGIRFVEVKEGSSQLSKHQKQIKEVIDDLSSDEVSFETFRFKADKEGT